MKLAAFHAHILSQQSLEKAFEEYLDYVHRSVYPATQRAQFSTTIAIDQRFAQFHLKMATYFIQKGYTVKSSSKLLTLSW